MAQSNQFVQQQIYTIYHILQARDTGRHSRVDIRAGSYRLTQLEEDSLVDWILSMDSRRAAPRPLYCTRDGEYSLCCAWVNYHL